MMCVPCERFVSLPGVLRCAWALNNAYGQAILVGEGFQRILQGEVLGIKPFLRPWPAQIAAVSCLALPGLLQASC